MSKNKRQVRDGDGEHDAYATRRLKISNNQGKFVFDAEQTMRFLKNGEYNEALEILSKYSHMNENYIILRQHNKESDDCDVGAFFDTLDCEEYYNLTLCALEQMYEKPRLFDKKQITGMLSLLTYVLKTGPEPNIAIDDAKSILPRLLAITDPDEVEKFAEIFISLGVFEGKQAYNEVAIDVLKCLPLVGGRGDQKCIDARKTVLGIVSLLYDYASNDTTFKYSWKITTPLHMLYSELKVAGDGNLSYRLAVMKAICSIYSLKKIYPINKFFDDIGASNAVAELGIFFENVKSKDIKDQSVKKECEAIGRRYSDLSKMECPPE